MAIIFAIVAISFPTVVAQQDEVRALYEIPESQMPEPGLDPFVEKYMEPTGAACMAHVREGSPNHKLMKKLASVTRETDIELWELDLRIAAVLNHEDEEGLVIVKRQYAKYVWDQLNQTGLDGEPIIFPGTPGKPWKKKQVRKWMLENAFPTFNFRLPVQKTGTIPRFPFEKYFGPANTQGVGLVALNIGEDDVETLQIRLVTTLRPHIKKLLGKFRFTVMEKSEFTLPARRVSKLGMDADVAAELVLIENPQTIVPRDRMDNYWHGNPTKYRLTNFSKQPLAEFFSGYHARTLPTYWASSEVAAPRFDGGAIHLTSDSFQKVILQADKKVGAFVAFFNMMDVEKSCSSCAERLVIWGKVAEELKRKHKALSSVLFGSLDQSTNEHPESKVAARLSEPVVMWYPPGGQKQRWNRRMFLHSMALDFTETDLKRKVLDFLMDQDDVEL